MCVPVFALFNNTCTHTDTSADKTNIAINGQSQNKISISECYTNLIILIIETSWTVVVEVTVGRVYYVH